MIRTIPVAKPLVGKEEIEAVKKVLESGMLAEGSVAHELEKQFTAYIGTKFATVTSNGTTALSTALEAMNIQPGDEVITTPFTFIASANTIAMLGAIPIFVDVQRDTYNIDPDLIEKAITKKTKAIMPVHIFGMPCDMKRIMKIAEAHSLQVIEDAAQAHGATIEGKKIGSFGHTAAFSFYATKNMMTGEGGMIVTDDEEIYDRAMMIKNHGRGKEGGYSHHRIGYNNRMMDLVAAIGIEQLKRLPGVLAARRRNAQAYEKLCSELKGIRPQVAKKGFESAYHVYAPCLNSPKMNRDKMIEYLKQNEIGTRTVYALPCHKQDTYLNIGNWRWARFVKYPNYAALKLPNSEEIGAQHFEIPVHPSVTDQDRTRIDQVIRKALS